MLHLISRSPLHSQLVRTVSRRGAAAVECALVLPVAFFAVFSLLDLGLAALRYNSLSEVTRRIAREAVLHGSLAPSSNGTWGPSAYEGTLSDASPIVAKAKSLIPTMSASDVTVQVTWPDDDNSPRDRVQVEVAYRHAPLIPGLCPWGPLNLRSVATMHIVN
jgi:Flp pilus assembly protein TadG